MYKATNTEHVTFFVKRELLDAMRVECMYIDSMCIY